MSEDVQYPVLAGKVAVVSGATRGIGRAIALRLARAGARVGFCYRREEDAAARLRDDLAALGRASFGTRVDIVDGAAEVDEAVVRHSCRQVAA